MNLQGTIVAAFGRHYLIATGGDHTITGHPRGKRSLFACGDEVTVTPDGQIIDHRPRDTLLFRSDPYRQKLIAANATQIVLVVAVEPSFSDMLLSRAIVAASAEGIKVLLVLNKCDLAEHLDAVREALSLFANLAYPVVEIVARQDVSALQRHLAGERSVLVGQSGMGKSTIVNRLIPDATAATREISTALDSGKHTTTHSRLYRLPGGGDLIDSPGLQEFGLAQLDRRQIEAGFVEFRPLLGQCRFNDCRHEEEPGCAIKQAAADGRIHPRRLGHFRQIVQSGLSR